YEKDYNFYLSKNKMLGVPKHGNLDKIVFFNNIKKISMSNFVIPCLDLLYYDEYFSSDSIEKIQYYKCLLQEDHIRDEDKIKKRFPNLKEIDLFEYQLFNGKKISRK